MDITQSRPQTGQGKTITLGMSESKVISRTNLKTAQPIKLQNQPLGTKPSLSIKAKPSLGKLRLNLENYNEDEKDKNDGFDPSMKKKENQTKLGGITLKKQAVIVKKMESESESISFDGDDNKGVIVQSEVQKFNEKGEILAVNIFGVKMKIKRKNRVLMKK